MWWTVIGVLVALLGALAMVAPDLGGRHSFGANPPWWGKPWPNRTEQLVDRWKKTGIALAMLGALLILISIFTSD